MKKIVRIYLNETDKKKRESVVLVCFYNLGFIFLDIWKYSLNRERTDFIILVLSLISVTIFIAMPKSLGVIKKSLFKLENSTDLFNIGMGIVLVLSLINLFLIVDMENIAGNNIKLPTAVVISIISLIRFLYYKKKNK